MVTSPVSEPNLSRLGFFTLQRESLHQLEFDEYSGLCPLDSKSISLLFTFKDLTRNPHCSFHKLFSIKNPGNYLFQFANCNPESLVTMDVCIELYNINDVGKRNFLSAGQTQLPYIYLFFALIYLCFLGFWVLICFKNRHQKYFYKIHIVMGGLLVVTVVELLFAAADRGYVKVMGTSHGWNVPFYIFQFFRSVLLYFVIALIGAGWSFLPHKPLRLAKEKMALLVLFIFQCVTNVASIVIRETRPFGKHWETWITVYFVVEIICSLTSLIPNLLTANWLREVSKADAKAARSWPGTALFLQCLLASIYLELKLAFWKTKMSGERDYWWVYNTGSNSGEEIINLVFYMLIFYMFRPVEQNRLIVGDVGDEVEVQEKNEEFVLVCISRTKFEEATKMGLWDEDDGF